MVIELITNLSDWNYTRPITIERKFLRRPNCNILTICQLEGNLLKEQVESAIIRLGKKHPLLFAHIEFNSNKKPIYVVKSPVRIPIIDIKAKSSTEWIQIVEQEHLHYFPLDVGPLSRILLVHYDNNCVLLLNCHHLIADGLSCTYVIKDILEYIEDLNKIYPTVADPPLANENAPIKVKLSWKLSLMAKLILKLSAKYPHTFTEDQFQALHQKYWTKFAFTPKFIPIQLSSQDSLFIVNACKKHNITISAFLNTIFMETSQNLFGNKEKYLRDVGFIANIRQKFKIPVGEHLGLFASGVITSFKYNQKKSFWDNAAKLNTQYQKQMKHENNLWEIYHYMAQMNHSILDTLYFVGYDELKIPELDRYTPLIKRIGACTTIDNLGKFAFPITYGNRNIKALYGPVIFSNMVQILIGVISAGNQMCFALTYSPNTISKDMVEKIWKNSFDRMMEVCQP